MINLVDNIIPLILSSLGLITAIGNWFFSRSLFKRKNHKKAVIIKINNKAPKSAIKALEKNIKAAEEPSDEVVKVLNKALERASDEDVPSGKLLNKHLTKYSVPVTSSEVLNACARKSPKKK